MQPDSITVYSTHCPNCDDLEKKLQAKRVPFELVDDLSQVETKAKELDQTMVPFVVVKGPSTQIFNYQEALHYFQL